MALHWKETFWLSAHAVMTDLELLAMMVQTRARSCCSPSTMPTLSLAGQGRRWGRLAKVILRVPLHWLLTWIMLISSGSPCHWILLMVSPAWLSGPGSMTGSASVPMPTIMARFISSPSMRGLLITGSSRESSVTVTRGSRTLISVWI